MKKYIVEFIGTFFLILTIVITVNGNVGSFAPIAIGTMLMVMIYSGGHVSGAHYNPAVTLAVWLRGKCASSDIPGYLIAQLLAAVVAAFLGKFLLGFILDDVVIAKSGAFDVVGGGLAEFLGTFALVWVILNVATAKSTANNSYFGLAIGLTVTACAYTLGPISGGAFNPAVALGVSAVEMTSWANFPVFIVSQLLAGVAAAYLFLYINGKD